MKQMLLILSAFMISMAAIAQGKSEGKGKAKNKQNQGPNTSVNQNGNSKDKKSKDDRSDNEKKNHDKKVWEGTYQKDADGPKPSKNQPAKVKEAFSREYPGAQNITWSKYRGDWTAAFKNGVFTSTAVYHANGERKDTRTPIPQQEVPRNILDTLFKRRPQTQRTEEVIKVELPERNRHLFRFKEFINGAPRFFFVDDSGNEVKYDY